MMKLAHIKFIIGTNAYSPGEYAFKLDTDFLTVEIGDILKDTRYCYDMKVMKISVVKSSKYYKGFLLKSLKKPYTTIVTKAQKEDMDHTKSIEISLEEAREWYEGNNRTLRILALKAYSEEELTKPRTFEEVLARLNLQMNVKIDTFGAELPTKDMNQIELHIKLAVVAMYLNGKWEAPLYGEKYFIGQNDQTLNIEYERLTQSFGIYTHEHVKYPGIVYFRTKEDAREAYNILKKDFRKL